MDRRADINKVILKADEQFDFFKCTEYCIPETEWEKKYTVNDQRVRLGQAVNLAKCMMDSGCDEEDLKKVLLIYNVCVRAKEYSLDMDKAMKVCEYTKLFKKYKPNTK